jgi:transposase-like protein
MSKSTISTYEILKQFPDANAARLHLERVLWRSGPVCPFCRKNERLTARARVGFHRCNGCKKDFTIRTGTIFERSHVPLDKWMLAIYLLMTARKGVSSLQLAKELGITQRSAWFVLHRIREACGNDLTVLRGIVEIDETFIGGSERTRHANKRRKDGARGAIGKQAVLGMRERGGRVIAKPVKNVRAETLHTEIHRNIERGATLHTDEAAGYNSIGELFYDHATVNHSGGEYARNGVTTNSIESVWAVMKRGLHGVYHHCQDKHVVRYVNEFTFRLNDGNVTRHTMDRIDSLLVATAGQRITYAELTA